MSTLFLGGVTIPRNFAPPGSQRRGLSSRRLRLNCGAAGSRMEEDWVSSPTASPYQILGIDPVSCSTAQLKAAFRARKSNWLGQLLLRIKGWDDLGSNPSDSKWIFRHRIAQERHRKEPSPASFEPETGCKVKEYHPDVCKDMKDSDLIIKRVIRAYEVLLKHYQHESPESRERTCLDPFEDPECEAYDLFVNEVLCMGKGCSYSCVERAPHAFSFIPENGTARAISQGHDEDYLVQLAVGQCPRRCIHYVTPSQRAVLEELLYSIINCPYDPAEVALLESLISKAKFENNRYQKPKRRPKVSTEIVDWF